MVSGEARDDDDSKVGVCLLESIRSEGSDVAGAADGC